MIWWREEALDYCGRERIFFCEAEINPQVRKRLIDKTLKVKTYYYIDSCHEYLPGRIIANPPPLRPQSVSAHANVSDVATFFRQVLLYTPNDGSNPSYISSISCIEDPQGNYSQCPNAYWSDDYQQAFFGQQMVNGQLRSYAVAQDIVAHEFTHALTSWTAGLEYIRESGALDESYADIFGILIANFRESDIGRWNWDIGSGFGQGGGAMRNLQQPSRCNQPEHMNQYLNLPDYQDHGGVHHNSGIHNKAAYNLLTSLDNQGNYLFDGISAAKLFYLGLTKLSKQSSFRDSRRALEQAAKTLFRRDPTKAEKLKAITTAFNGVGIV